MSAGGADAQLVVRTLERRNRAPLATSWVMLIAGDSTTRSVWTDSTGVARLNGIAEGDYTLWVRQFSHLPWRGPFAARNGFRDTLELLLTDYGPCIQEQNRSLEDPDSARQRDVRHESF